MSTLPPGAQGLPPGAVPLDGPPPPPQPMQAPVGAGYNGLAAPGEGEGNAAKDQMQGLMQAFQTVDQILMTAAASMPDAQQQFGAARKLIEEGLAKGLASMGQSPEVSSTAAGGAFPGGGFSSVGAVGR